jgi:zinc transport system substrate-binding protein
MRELTVTRWLFRLSATLLVALLTTAAIADDRARVVAVNYPLAYFAERLAGDDVEVVFPVPAGADPSFWRPTVSDISAIQSADLILLNGAGFATWVDRVSLPRARLVNTSAALSDRFIATESITHSHGDGGEHSHEGLAAYTWLDTSLAIAQAEAVAAALVARDLAPEADVEARLAALRADIEAMDAAARVALDGVEEAMLVATHPRYQYLARAYGLTIGSLEWDAGAMPDAEQLAALAAMIKGQDAPVLIWEAAPPDAAIDAVADLGAVSVVFPPLAHAPAEGDYVAALSASVAALAEAIRQRSLN